MLNLFYPRMWQPDTQSSLVLDVARALSLCGGVYSLTEMKFLADRYHFDSLASGE